ncbi:MAG: SMP-30/gluconolactonase/LRE family protein [Alphaproteobacteria bacterium]|nr:SMP-30/gluconolactonase/LRE family protein [Alphaproteobacteria bacterium]
MSLFAPPKDIQARVFSRLPDRLRRDTGSAWTVGNRPGVPTDCFLEGPSFDAEGNLWLVDIPNGRILRVSADGRDWDEVVAYDGWPNGLKFHSDGRIFVADYKRGVLTVDPRTGAVETIVGDRYSEGLIGVNDLHFADNGDLYFTDQGQTGLHDPRGRVYRLTAAGRLDKLLDTAPSPNGLVLTPQQNALYVAMTRANAVWRLPLMPDGHVSKVGQFIQLSGGFGPDGMAIDETGGLAVAHFGLGTVWHFSPLGEPLHRVRSPVGNGTTNVAFGGAGRRTLFITESETGTVLAADLPVAGLPMFGPTAG